MCQTGPKVLFLQVLVPLPSFSLHSLLMKSGTTEAPLGSKIAGCQRLALLVAPPVMFMVKSQGPMTYGDGNSQRSWGWYIYIYIIYIHTQYVRDDIQATSRWFERFTTCHQPSVCQLLFGGVKPAVKKPGLSTPRCHGTSFRANCLPRLECMSQMERSDTFDTLPILFSPIVHCKGFTQKYVTAETGLSSHGQRCVSPCGIWTFGITWACGKRLLKVAVLGRLNRSDLQKQGYWTTFGRVRIRHITNPKDFCRGSATALLATVEEFVDTDHDRDCWEEEVDLRRLIQEAGSPNLFSFLHIQWQRHQNITDKISIWNIGRQFFYLFGLRDIVRSLTHFWQRKFPPALSDKISRWFNWPRRPGILKPMTMGSPLPSWTKPLTPHTSGILRGIGSTCWIYAAGTGTGKEFSWWAGKAEFTVAFGEAPAASQLLSGRGAILGS